MPIGRQANSLPHISILLNPAAGSYSPGVRARLDHLLAGTPVIADILQSTDSDAEDLAHAAFNKGHDAVVAGGGDGTISSVASALAGTDVPLGILPLGTWNHFAKDVGIPLRLEDAFETILDGNTGRVDVGEVNGRTFLNNSSIGVYPHLVRFRVAHRRKGSGKWTAFALALVAVFRRSRLLRVRLIVNQRELVRKTPFLFVGNNEYDLSGGRARLDEGRLQVVVAHHKGRFGLLRSVFSALVNRTKENRDFDVLRPTEFRIESRHRFLRVALDGEVHKMKTPLNYRIRPGALRVLIPRPDGDK
ncbi:MAG: sphingosine kinase [Acidobacteriota bacterium]|nr:sphingosine kinase [Acidobacteriota bacterium]